MNTPKVDGEEQAALFFIISMGAKSYYTWRFWRYTCSDT